MMQIKFKKIDKNVKTPTYGSSGAACFDFYSPVDYCFNLTFANKIGLGIAVEVPKGYALIIAPRSSTGLKTSLRQSNSIGIIDSDYRGEINAIFDKLGYRDENIKAGDRIAQGFLIKVPEVELIEVDELSSTERNEGGFGSTGK